MKKALEMLKELHNKDILVMQQLKLEHIQVCEAIAELEAMNLTRREWYQKGFNEAMKQRTCEGCKYEYSDELEEPCKNCKRNTPDFYAKDNS